MTGYSEDTLRVSFEDHDIQGLLIKPFNYNELIASVDAALSPNS